MPEITSYGIRISYDDQGQGEPAIFFMPGWCGSRRVFDPLAEQVPHNGTPWLSTGVAMGSWKRPTMISEPATSLTRIFH